MNFLRQGFSNVIVWQRQYIQTDRIYRNYKPRLFAGNKFCTNWPVWKRWVQTASCSTRRRSMRRRCGWQRTELLVRPLPAANQRRPQPPDAEVAAVDRRKAELRYIVFGRPCFYFVSLQLYTKQTSMLKWQWQIVISSFSLVSRILIGRGHSHTNNVKYIVDFY